MYHKLLTLIVCQALLLLTLTSALKVLAGLSSQAIIHLTITLQIIVKSLLRLIVAVYVVCQVLISLRYSIVYAHRLNVLNVSQTTKINNAVVCYAL